MAIFWPFLDLFDSFSEFLLIFGIKVSLFTGELFNNANSFSIYFTLFLGFLYFDFTGEIFFIDFTKDKLKPK